MSNDKSQYNGQSGNGYQPLPCAPTPPPGPEVGTPTLADVQPGGRVRLGNGLLPCPFCGAPAERIDFGIGSGENEGGSCIACTVCQHSGPIEFGYKENFISNWNRRTLSAQPSPPSSFDLEAMLAACVPGGDMADPQVIADNIRHWFAALPSPGGQGDARRQWLEIRGLAAAIVKNLQAFADSPHKAAWCGALDDSLLFADQIEKAAAAAYEADLERRRMA